MLEKMEISNNPYSLNEIRDAIAHGFSQIEELVMNSSDDQFNQQVGGKWSIGENLDHLVLSTMGIASALAKPKDFFERFGQLDRDVLSYEDLDNAYQAKEVRVAPPHVSPDATNPKSKDELLQSWRLIAGKYQQRMPKYWSEEELDQHCLPHPAAGMLCMREHLMFIALHNQHHLRAMQAQLV